MTSNGLPSNVTTRRYTTSQLQGQPFVPALINVICEAYRDIHKKADPPIFPNDHGRVESESQLLTELGPDGLILVAFDQSSAEPEPVGCVGLKALQERGRRLLEANFNNEGAVVNTGTPGTEIESGNANDFLREGEGDNLQDMGEAVGLVPAEAKGGAEEPVTQWEICLICSRPGSKFRSIGLPTKLLGMMEEEVRKLVSVPLSSSPSDTKNDAPDGHSHKSMKAAGDRRKATLVICIVTVLTGKWWANKEYTIFWDETKPIGSWGAYREFLMQWGVKVLDAYEN
ncbi:MAG: hypothetical protein M1837_006705 [Sclerophora amabilis]|nr:MAG: hypothetical protein M1837_006705 [Sclerophora amabilis]